MSSDRRISGGRFDFVPKDKPGDRTSKKDREQIREGYREAKEGRTRNEKIETDAEDGLEKRTREEMRKAHQLRNAPEKSTYEESEEAKQARQEMRKAYLLRTAPKKNTNEESEGEKLAREQMRNAPEKSNKGIRLYGYEKVVIVVVLIICIIMVILASIK